MKCYKNNQQTFRKLGHRYKKNSSLTHLCLTSIFIHILTKFLQKKKNLDAMLGKMYMISHAVRFTK